MTANQFRRLALRLPGAEESSHMGHPDFRVGGKIFASLGTAGSDTAMVKVSLDEQRQLVHDEPDVFEPFNGAWGRWGCTKVHLPKATAEIVRGALRAAWRNTAPKKMLEENKGND
jgi:hypothetical protein